ncbi:MAG: imidazole glycerol phosphate synthase subunit HisH [Rhodothermales bacterium]
MITIIDYGIGNLRSIEKAFEAVGADVIRSDREDDITRAEKVVLPGVGAFGACAAEIRKRDLEGPIQDAIDAGKPFLGVCVGMQLLFDVGEEMGSHEGLGVLPGRVLRFDAVPSPTAHESGPDPQNGSTRKGKPGGVWMDELKIPHMGWNTIQKKRDSPLLAGLAPEAYFYFVHSFVAVPEAASDVLATSRYGVPFPAVVHRNNVFGVQFHPEKSQKNGLRILRNFAELSLQR